MTVANFEEPTLREALEEVRKLCADPILNRAIMLSEIGRIVNAALSIGGEGDGSSTTGASAHVASQGSATATEAPLSAGRVRDARTGLSVPGPQTQATVEAFPLHHSTAVLVNQFALALAEKLAKAEQKYGYSDGWKSEDWEGECRAQLHHHAAKGDPRDVAAYAAFCWHHGWSTALPAPSSPTSTAGSEGGELEKAQTRIAELETHMRGLLHGLPDILESGGMVDEEGLIEAAWFMLTRPEVEAALANPTKPEGEA